MIADIKLTVLMWGWIFIRSPQRQLVAISACLGMAAAQLGETLMCIHKGTPPWTAELLQRFSEKDRNSALQIAQ